MSDTTLTQDDDDPAQEMIDRAHEIAQRTYTMMRGDQQEGVLPSTLAMHWDNIDDTMRSLLVQVVLDTIRGERG